MSEPLRKIEKFQYYYGFSLVVMVLRGPKFLNVSQPYLMKLLERRQILYIQVGVGCRGRKYGTSHTPFVKSST